MTEIHGIPYWRIQNTPHFHTENLGLNMQQCRDSNDGTYENKPFKPWHILLNGA